MTVEHHHTIDNHSYVDWASILAGAAIATAMSFVLLAFGSAIGLAVVSPWSSSGPSAATIGIGAPIFVALVQIWAVASGAYLAGRLRPKAHDSQARDELRFRDGINGLVVWAVAALLGVVLASSVISRTVGMAGQTAAALAGTTADALARLSHPILGACPSRQDRTLALQSNRGRQAVTGAAEAGGAGASMFPPLLIRVRAGL